MPSSDTDGRASVVAGVDIGGTKCLGVLLAPDGRVLAEERVPTPHGASNLVDAVVSVVEVLSGGSADPIAAVGVGAPGLVDHRGVLRAAPNLVGVTEMPIRDEVAERVGLPVTVDNDATCALLAEWRHGVAKGANDVVLVTLGTGIGGGVVAGGELQRGANGFASEPGHMVVDPNGPPCVCGRRGCWERYASGSGLARLARDAAFGGRALGRRAARRRRSGGREGRARDAGGARAATRRREQIIDEFGRWVALGLVNLTNLLDPEMIVLGGGLVSEAGPHPRADRDGCRGLLYAPAHRPQPRAGASAVLGERAGAIGAALPIASRSRSGA